jgi:hypothetical protein
MSKPVGLGVNDSRVRDNKPAQDVNSGRPAKAKRKAKSAVGLAASEAAGAGAGLLVPGLRVRPSPSTIPDPVSAEAKADLDARVARWRVDFDNGNRSSGADVLGAWFQEHFGSIACLTPEQAFRVHEYLDGVEKAVGALFAGLTLNVTGHLREYAATWTTLARQIAVPDYDRRPDSVMRSTLSLLQSAFGSFQGERLQRRGGGEKMTADSGRQALALLQLAMDAADPGSVERQAFISATKWVNDYLAVLALAERKDLQAGKVTAAKAAVEWIESHAVSLAAMSAAQATNLAQLAQAMSSAENQPRRDRDNPSNTSDTLHGLMDLAGILAQPERAAAEISQLFYQAIGTEKWDEHYRVTAACLEALAPSLSPAMQKAIADARRQADAANAEK